MSRLAKQLLVSLTVSGILSVLATLWGGYLLRRVIGKGEGAEEAGEARPQRVNVNVMVFVVPVAVGNVMAPGRPGALRYLLMRKRRRKN